MTKDSNLGPVHAEQLPKQEGRSIDTRSEWAGLGAANCSYAPGDTAAQGGAVTSPRTSRPHTGPHSHTPANVFTNWLKPLPHKGMSSTASLSEVILILSEMLPVMGDSPPLQSSHCIFGHSSCWVRVNNNLLSSAPDLTALFLPSPRSVGSRRRKLCFLRAFFSTLSSYNEFLAPHQPSFSFSGARRRKDWFWELGTHR